MGKPKRNTIKRLIVIICVIIAAVTIGIVIAALGHFNFQQEQRSRINQLGLVSDKVTDDDKENYHLDSTDKPRFLTIPILGITRSRIQEVGLLAPSADGNQQMDAPKNIHDVGWYNCQINPIKSNQCANYASPVGSNLKTASVIDGHSCGGNSCVFNGLANLKQADEITVELESGQKVTYLVNSVETVDLADLDMEKVMALFNDGQAGLNLITCDGSWSSRDSRGVITMNKRIVVYSTKKII